LSRLLFPLRIAELLSVMLPLLSAERRREDRAPCLDLTTESKLVSGRPLLALIGANLLLVLQAVSCLWGLF
jgi:hypothetical protein